jgi:hypothetical protein
MEANSDSLIPLVSIAIALQWFNSKILLINTQNSDPVADVKQTSRSHPTSSELKRPESPTRY